MYSLLLPTKPCMHWLGQVSCYVQCTLSCYQQSHACTGLDRFPATYSVLSPATNKAMHALVWTGFLLRTVYSFLLPTKPCMHWSGQVSCYVQCTLSCYQQSHACTGWDRFPAMYSVLSPATNKAMHALVWTGFLLRTVYSLLLPTKPCMHCLDRFPAMYSVLSPATNKAMHALVWTGFLLRTVYSLLLPTKPCMHWSGQVSCYVQCTLSCYQQSHACTGLDRFPATYSVLSPATNKAMHALVWTGFLLQLGHNFL